MSDLRERWFTMDLRSGRILDATPEADSQRVRIRWRYLGELDPATGRSTVDYSAARRWRPIEEFSRW
jgi:hypothetical protein